MLSILNCSLQRTRIQPASMSGTRSVAYWERMGSRRAAASWGAYGSWLSAGSTTSSGARTGTIGLSSCRPVSRWAPVWAGSQPGSTLVGPECPWLPAGGCMAPCLAHLEHRCDRVCMRLGDDPRCGGRTARAPAHAVGVGAGGALGTPPAGTPVALRVQAPRSWGLGHPVVPQDTGPVARLARWLQSEQPLAFAMDSVTVPRRATRRAQTVTHRKSPSR
jgi:hypothetical protein